MDIIQFRTWWVNLCSTKKNRLIITFIGLLVVASTSLLAFFHPLGAMAQICLLAAVWMYDQPWSHLAAIAAFILFALFSMIFFIMAIFIFLYYLKILLDRLRLKRLKKIAQKTPREIAGIQNDEPEVEIIIKGNKQ